MYINSALVSAQNRQRFYAFNWEVEQPEDRGILLKDILETGENLTSGDKSYCLTASYDGACPWNTIERSQRTMVAEPVNTVVNGKSHTLKAQYYKNGIANFVTNGGFGATAVAEPIRVGDLPNAKGEISGSQTTRIYSTEGKSVNLIANGGGQGAKTGLYAVPADDRINRLGGLYNQATRWGIYDTEGCSPTLTASMGMGGGHVPMVTEPTCEVGHTDRNPTDKKQIYEVKDGQITIKGKQYPIKLPDGYYIIRKLTVKECCRLQTMPDDYCKAVSNSQAYKGLGNGWTAEVIIHILNGALKDVPRDEEIIVLSLYDGIGTGRYCLDKMGFTNVKYYAYEIDPHPIKVAMDNYPDIIQCGDAFAVREDDWKAPQTRSEWLDELFADCEVS